MSEGSRDRGQPGAGAQDRRNGSRRGKPQGEAEKQGRRDDSAPGDGRDERMDLHGRDAAPDQEKDRIGDPVVTAPRPKECGEKGCGGERADRGAKEEKSPSRIPRLNEEKDEKIRQGGKPGPVPKDGLRRAFGRAGDGHPSGVGRR